MCPFYSKHAKEKKRKKSIVNFYKREKQKGPTSCPLEFHPLNRLEIGDKCVLCPAPGIYSGARMAPVPREPQKASGILVHSNQATPVAMLILNLAPMTQRSQRNSY